MDVIEAITEVVLYSITDKEVKTVVDVGLYYSHPPEITAYIGTIEKFMEINPEYTYNEGYV